MVLYRFVPGKVEFNELHIPRLDEQGSLAKVYRKEIELPFGEKLLIRGEGEQSSPF